jgi:hypothetical protein
MKSQIWKLSAWCPECCKALAVLNSSDITQVMKRKDYLERMLQDDRPVSKCKDCGAYHDSFVIKAVY